MTLQGNVREALTKYFEDELKSNLSLVDDYLEYEESTIKTQNAIIRKRAEMQGYISCLDDLDVFEEDQIEFMYDKVYSAFEAKQERLDEKIAR